MRRFLLLTAILVLAGCATTAGFEKLLNSWVGLDELALVRSWGAPVQVYEVGGRKFIVYSSRRNVFIPGTAPTYQTTYIGNTAHTSAVGGAAAMNIGMSCSTTFEIESSKVVSWTYKGNDCKAKE